MLCKKGKQAGAASLRGRGGDSHAKSGGQAHEKAAGLLCM